MNNTHCKLPYKSTSTCRALDSSMMEVISCGQQPLRNSTQFADSGTIPCRRSNIKSFDSSISSLWYPLSQTQRQKQALDEFPQDEDQLLCYKDSTGTESFTKPPLSKSIPSGSSKIALHGQVPLPCKAQSNGKEWLLTCYPPHQGSRTTVSSADGTTLYADDESDSGRNTAAQSLFRALQRQQTSDKLRTLDRHIDKIFGAVDMDVSIQNTMSMRKVDIVENSWDTGSYCGIIDEAEGGMRRRWARKMGERWHAWAAKMSRFLG